MKHVQWSLGASERRACQVLGQPRTTQRRQLVVRDDEGPLTRAIIDLATEYGRYGYRRVTALLNHQGWEVNHKRVERVWRREGLKVPMRQPKRARLWLNDGSCIRLRAQYPNHVWSYDFVMARTHDGRAYRLLTLIDEYTHESLAIEVKRKLNSMDVLDCLGRLFVSRPVPEYIARTMARSSLPWPSGSGCLRQRSRPCSLNRDRPGRPVIMKASTASSGMSYLTGRSFTP